MPQLVSLIEGARWFRLLQGEADYITYVFASDCCLLILLPMLLASIRAMRLCICSAYKLKHHLPDQVWVCDPEHPLCELGLASSGAGSVVSRSKKSRLVYVILYLLKFLMSPTSKICPHSTAGATYIVEHFRSLVDLSILYVNIVHLCFSSDNCFYYIRKLVIYRHGVSGDFITWPMFTCLLFFSPL